MLKATYDPIIAAMQALAATHATQHRSAGTDSIKLDDLAAPDDNTDLDYSIFKHGLTPKGMGLGHFLKDNGTWAAATDQRAIHDNVNGEFFAVTPDLTPSYTDLVLLEDYNASYAKKFTTLQGLQLRNLVLRPDPASHDWTKANLTADGSWHTLDCSSIVPAWASFILFRVILKDNLVGSFITLRRYGDTGTPGVTRVTTQAANENIDAQVFIACHKAVRWIEYRATNTTFDTLTLTIHGWFYDYTT